MILGALVGGLIGTTVLTTGLRVAQELGATRMDLPLLLGTVFTGNRRRAAPIGYAFHFFNGLAFALLYGVVFETIDRAGWLLGALLGIIHAGFAGGALVNVLLPAVHPRMGTRWTNARDTPLLEPPGFLLMNYGRATVLVTFAMHIVYGAIVGAIAAAA